MTQTVNKQKLLQALNTAYIFEQLPGVGRVIGNFKMKLSAHDFTSAIEFVSETIWRTMLEACDTNILEGIDYVIKNEPDRLEELITNLVTVNERVAKAYQNAINSSAVAIADLYQMEIE